MKFFDEKVFDHSGDTKKPTSMLFHVKWLEYDDSHSSWEPWKNLRLCEALRVYYKNHKLARLIPKNCGR